MENNYFYNICQEIKGYFESLKKEGDMIEFSIGNSDVGWTHYSIIRKGHSSHKSLKEKYKQGIKI